MSDTSLAVLLSAASLAVAGAGTCAMVSVDAPIPPPPARPATAAPTRFTHFRYQEGFYRALVAEDAARAQLLGFDPEALRAVADHGEDFRGRHRLAPGERLQTAHLRVSLRSSTQWVEAGGQGYKAPHLILAIENLTDRPLAYLVETVLLDPAACATRGVIEHNAIALGPRETVERSECISQRGNDLFVTRVEVMGVTPLGHHYLSRLLPAQIGLDPRSGAGHTPPDDRPCGHVPVDLLGPPSRRLDRWADVIDFYARHNCDEYSFFREYTRRTEPLPKLMPAVPPAAP